jgi:hypothetical protein
MINAAAQAVANEVERIVNPPSDNVVSIRDGSKHTASRTRSRTTTTRLPAAGDVDDGWF